MPLCSANLHEISAASLEADYCPLCAVCSVCGSGLKANEYHWARDYGKAIAHPRCLALTELPRDTAASITVDQKTFDLLNACRLLLEPLPECSDETNRYDADCRLQSTRWIKDLPLEGKFLLLSRIEAIAAGISLILSKDRERIKIELNQREAAKFAAATKQAKLENRPKSEKRTLDQRGKAIKALLAIGMSESDAIASVDKRLSEQGKVIQ